MLFHRCSDRLMRFRRRKRCSAAIPLVATMSRRGLDRAINTIIQRAPSKPTVACILLASTGHGYMTCRINASLACIYRSLGPPPQSAALSPVVTTDVRQ